MSNILDGLRAALAAGHTTQAEVLGVLHDAGDKFPAYAADVETDDDFEVDDKPLYSKSPDGGVWVSAWVFVRDPETAEG